MRHTLVVILKIELTSPSRASKRRRRRRRRETRQAY
jgi:hypothetical protein